MSKRSLSIKEVATAAGVSTATVSNVFSGKKAVKPELADHVRAIAAQMGYRVNKAASNLRSGNSRIVTVLVPDLSDPFFTSLVTHIEDHAQADGYDIIVANAKDDLEVEQRRIAALMSWQPAGMVVIPCSDKVPENLDSTRGEFPVVIVDRGAEAKGYDTVHIDNRDAGAIAANHLVKLGHRRVMVVASDLGLKAIRDRCEGVSERIRSVGGETDILEVGAVPKKGASKLARWLERNNTPTAVVAVTDMTTLAVLTCFAERDCEVGSDISMVGFDDFPWMSARRTPITAVCQPVEEMAAGIWTTLKNRMDGISTKPITIELQCSLHVRTSTRRISDTKQELLDDVTGPAVEDGKDGLNKMH